MKTKIQIQTDNLNAPDIESEILLKYSALNVYLLNTFLKAVSGF